VDIVMQDDYPCGQSSDHGGGYKNQRSVMWKYLVYPPQHARPHGTGAVRALHGGHTGILWADPMMPWA